MCVGNLLLTWSVFLLFAQGSSPGELSWGQVVTSLGSLGSAGFTGWLTYHLITKWIPDMTAKFERSIEQARAEYRADLETQRKHDAGENQKERDECNKRFEVLEKRHDSSYLIIREINHGVKNILQTRANEQAISELKGRRPAHAPKPREEDKE